MLICDSQVGLELVDCFGLCGIYRNNTVTIVDGVSGHRWLAVESIKLLRAGVFCHAGLSTRE